MGRPGLQILKPGPYPAQTMVGPTQTRPDPKKPGPAQLAQIIQEQGLSQFYLKMSIILTLVVE